MLRRPAGIVAAVAVLTGISAAASGVLGQNFFAQAEPSFTAAQAARGKAVYDLHCASCHGAKLDDGQFGTPLTGASFRARWASQSPDALFTYIVQKMPPGAQGSLGDKAYAEVQAYILQANGVKAGAKEFAAARMPAGSPANPVANPSANSPAANPPANPAASAFVNNANYDAVYKATMAARKELLDAMRPVTEAMLRNPDDGDWLLWRRTYDTTSFSPLRQISRENVDRLGVAWSLSLSPSINEITPFVHDGILFVQSGTTAQALNAATGEMLWQYTRSLPPSVNLRDARIKGIALFENSVFVPTADGHLIALNAKTGELLWDHAVIPTENHAASGRRPGANGHQLNSIPLVVNGKVIIGVSGGGNIPGGSYVVAVDSATGKQVWRFNTVTRPGEPGGDTWNGRPFDERFGAGVWTGSSYDAKRNLVYFGTGNTYNIGALLPRKENNDALYTNATIALNPDTGKLVWYYQHMQRDVWDQDWSYERSLVTIPVNGKPTDLVVTAGKGAIFDALERDTGKYVFSRDLSLTNVIVAIDPITGKKTTNPALEPVHGRPVEICPGGNGARNWLTTAFDPSSRIMYMPAIESCADYTWVERTPAEIAAGGSDIRFSQHPRPGADGNFGRLQAFNLETGEVVWTHRQRSAMASSLLLTQGDLLFAGAFDRTFRAYDPATGKVLWQTLLNAAPNASPITYTVKGEQYVAVTTGGGGPIDSGSGSMTPEIHYPPTNPVLWVFKLSGKK